LSQNFMNFGPLMAKNTTVVFTHHPTFLREPTVRTMEFPASQNFPHHLLAGGGHHAGLPLGVPTFLV